MAISYKEICRETDLKQGQVEKIMHYLDELRISGQTNMFGAAPYVTEKFADVTLTQAQTVLLFWMKTFAERQEKGG